MPPTSSVAYDLGLVPSIPAAEAVELAVETERLGFELLLLREELVRVDVVHGPGAGDDLHLDSLIAGTE